MPATNLESIVSLCKRRGFIFPSSEIYGGIGSTWDYGPLGVELKNRVKSLWWKSVVHDRDDVDGLDSAILMNRFVWKFSGHEATFADSMTDCRNCKTRPRADDLFRATLGRDPASLDDINTAIGAGQLRCPRCGSSALTPARPFNLMFKTTVGPVDAGDETGSIYLRPETAQGIFVNFAHVQETMRRKLPFGIAQIGKAFRNEITPGNFTFRTREFEQMELEYFVRPGEDEAAHQYWIDARLMWHRQLGLSAERLRAREQSAEELAHYSKRCVDIEYRFPMGWGEIEGIANRGDFDLRAHSRGPANPVSISTLRYFDQTLQRSIVPYVIEPSAGVDRTILALLCDAYDEELVRLPPPEVIAELRTLCAEIAHAEQDIAEADLTVAVPVVVSRIDRGDWGQNPQIRRLRELAVGVRDQYFRTVLRLQARIAPLAVAVFPLKRNERSLVEFARRTRAALAAADIRATYDDTGAIGKLYRRQDEIGTPFCVTIDFQTLQDRTVTLRSRDTMHQERLGIDELTARVRQALT